MVMSLVESIPLFLKLTLLLVELLLLEILYLSINVGDCFGSWRRGRHHLLLGARA
jgi:hypothetical protein